MAAPTFGGNLEPEIRTNSRGRRYSYGFDPKGIPGYGRYFGGKGGMVTIRSKEDGVESRRRVSIYPVMYPASAYGTSRRTLAGSLEA